MSNKTVAQRLDEARAKTNRKIDRIRADRQRLREVLENARRFVDSSDCSCVIDTMNIAEHTPDCAVQAMAAEIDRALEATDATEAIYQEIRECIQYRMEHEERIMQRDCGMPYVLAEARLEAYRIVLDDLYASRANMEGSRA